MRHGQRHDEFDSTSERHLRGYSVSAFSERAYQVEGSVWIRRAKPVKNSVKLFSQLRQIRPDEIAMSADSENKGGLVRCAFQDCVFVLLTHRFCLTNQTTKLQGTCCAINFRRFFACKLASVGRHHRTMIDVGKTIPSRVLSRPE